MNRASRDRGRRARPGEHWAFWSVWVVLVALTGIRCAHIPSPVEAEERIVETDLPPQEPLGWPDPPANPAPGEIWTVAGIELVWIPPGAFQMGSPRNEAQRNPDDEAQREVIIPQGFWLSAYEVTQAQWEAIMGTNPSHFIGHDLPVDSVSWDDCQAFIRMLNGGASGPFRLPTEAEWEYACRAGTSGAFHFGNRLTPALANYNGAYAYADGPTGKNRGGPTAVGSFAPNAWGLYDMHGNVWEWCEDIYDEYYDHSGRFHTTRVIRGGGWLSEGRSLRAAYAYGLNPASRRNFVGFRLCREP